MAARLKIIYRIQTNETTSSVIKVCNRQRLQLDRTVNNYESIESNENLLPMFSFCSIRYRGFARANFGIPFLGYKNLCPFRYSGSRDSRLAQIYLQTRRTPAAPDPILKDGWVLKGPCHLVVHSGTVPVLLLRLSPCLLNGQIPMG